MSVLSCILLNVTLLTFIANLMILNCMHCMIHASVLMIINLILQPCLSKPGDEQHGEHQVEHHDKHHHDARGVSPYAVIHYKDRRGLQTGYCGQGQAEWGRGWQE